MGCVEETAVAQPPKERACAELTEHATSMTVEGAGVEFIDENGGGPGLRLRKRQRAKKPK